MFGRPFGGPIDTARFRAPMNPLERTARETVMTPEGREKRDLKHKAYQTRIDAAPDAETKAALRIMEHMDVDQSIESEINKDTANDFTMWLQGRGRDEDHFRTPWGRMDLALQGVPGVGAFLEERMMARTKLQMTLDRMKHIFPGNLGELWMFYKHVIRGDPEHVTDDDVAQYLDFTNTWRMDPKYKPVGRSDGFDNNLPEDETVAQERATGHSALHDQQHAIRKYDSGSTDPKSMAARVKDGQIYKSAHPRPSTVISAEPDAGNGVRVEELSASASTPSADGGDDDDGEEDFQEAQEQAEEVLAEETPDPELNANELTGDQVAVEDSVAPPDEAEQDDGVEEHEEGDQPDEVSPEILNTPDEERVARAAAQPVELPSVTPDSTETPGVTTRSQAVAAEKRAADAVAALRQAQEAARKADERMAAVLSSQQKAAATRKKKKEAAAAGTQVSGEPVRRSGRGAARKSK